MSDPDSELEEDEEEILVYVEFDNFATNDVFSSENLKLDMLGLDSDHPIMQINGKFFEGTYENAPGTYLFFEKDNNPEIDDPVFDKCPTLKYFDKTRKLLRMQRAFLVPRYEVVGDSKNSKCIPNKETLKEAGVPPNYQEEALSFWKNSRNNRLDALHKYLKKQEFRKELRVRGFEPESESDDDNPFAMYKFVENKSNANKRPEYEEDNRDYDSQMENLQNVLQTDKSPNKEKKETPKKLTVIDPGPSTSKSSTPWIENDGSDELSFAKKVKSVGKVKSKNAKENVSRRTSNRISEAQRSLNENSTEQSLEISNTSNTHAKTQQNLPMENDKSTENNEMIHSNGKPKTTKKSKNSKTIKTEEMEIDEIATEESGRLLSMELKLSNSFMPDKKRMKQEKREAKMKEISERIKALKENSSP